MVKKEESKKESVNTEKKKAAAKKAVSKTVSRKAPATKKAAVKTPSPQKKPVKKAAPKSAHQEKKEKNRTPIFILIIMGLLTVILLLVNDQQNKTSSLLSFFRNSSSGKIIKTENFFSEENSRKNDPPDNNHEKRKEKDQREKTGKKIIEQKSDKDETKKIAEDLSVKVYFVRLNEKSEKLYLSSVKRKVKRKTKIRDSLLSLIQGPSPYEKKAGVLTAVPDSIRVRGIDIRGKTAVIDFNTAIESGATGSMLLKRIDQIVYTATQFDEIENVRIRINGQYRKTLGSDGLSISGPLHRR